MEAVDVGAHLPSAKEIKEAKLADCPYRNQLHPGDMVRCELATAQLGGPRGVSLNVCKMCQCNGAPSVDNPFIKYLLCHLAYDSVVAEPTAKAAKAPTDAEIDTAIGIIKASHPTEKVRGFVEALVWHESITAAKGAELIDAHALAAVAVK